MRRVPSGKSPACVPSAARLRAPGNDEGVALFLLLMRGAQGIGVEAAPSGVDGWTIPKLAVCLVDRSQQLGEDRSLFDRPQPLEGRPEQVDVPLRQ